MKRKLSLSHEQRILNRIKALLVNKIEIFINISETEDLIASGVVGLENTLCDLNNKFEKTQQEIDRNHLLISSFLN